VLVRVSCIQNTQIREETTAKVFGKVDTFWTYQPLIASRVVENLPPTITHVSRVRSLEIVSRPHTLPEIIPHPAPFQTKCRGFMRFKHKVVVFWNLS
jgi:hypothetical protein